MTVSSVAQAVISAEAASEVLSMALARAEATGVRVNIALVDSAGNLAGFLRMPGAFLASIDLAIDKAYCAASFQMTTRSFGEFLQTVPPAVRDGMLRRPRLTEVPGGVPITIGEALIGAIGVSGASAEEDEDVALAGLAAIAQRDTSEGMAAAADKP